MEEAILRLGLEPLLPGFEVIAPGLVLLAVAGLLLVRRARGSLWRLAAAVALLLLLLNPVLVEEIRRPQPDQALILVDESASVDVAPRRAQNQAALDTLKGAVAALPDLETRLRRLRPEGLKEAEAEAEAASGAESAAEAGTEAGTTVQEPADAAGADAATSPEPEAPRIPVATAGEGTRLIDALSLALADMPRERLAGVILLTDGQVHDMPADAAALAETLGLSAPVHVLVNGHRRERDRRLEVLRAPGFGLVGKPQELQIQVSDLISPDAPEERRKQQGQPRRAKLTLRQDGGGEQVLMVPVGRPHSVPFTLEHGGATILELEVAPAGEDELTLANNRAVITVNGVRERLRVLLVSGQPHPGERVWRNLLKSDPSVSLVHFTILRPPDKQDGTPIRELSLIAFPIRELFEVKLAEFDLVIFDRFRRRGVLPRAYLENIANYVRGGGALLMAVGEDHAGPLSLYRTPIGAVLPTRPTGRVLEGGFRPLVTALGHRHPVTAGLEGAAKPRSEAGEEDAAKPSWGRWFRQIEGIRQRGELLMTGASDRPLLILDRVGQGRVAVMLSDHLWLWARGFEGGGPQAELLRRLAHWLMKEPDLEENDLRAVMQGNRLVVTRRSLEPVDRPVTVTTPSGRTLPLAMAEIGQGRSQGSLVPKEAGLYRVLDQDPEEGDRIALAAAGTLDPKEMADLRSTPDILRPLAAETGGGVFRLVTAIWEQAAAGTDPGGAAQAALDGLRVPTVLRVDAEGPFSGKDWIGLKRSQGGEILGLTQTPLLPPWLGLLLAAGALVMAWYREGR